MKLIFRDLVGSALRNVGLAPAGEFRNPPLVRQRHLDGNIAETIARTQWVPATG